MLTKRYVRPVTVEHLAKRNRAESITSQNFPIQPQLDLPISYNITPSPVRMELPTGVPIRKPVGFRYPLRWVRYRSGIFLGGKFGRNFFGGLRKLFSILFQNDLVLNRCFSQNTDSSLEDLLKTFTPGFSEQQVNFEALR
jgi:hypothetical protein